MNFFQNLFSTSKNVDLKSMITQGAFLVDVREPSEYKLGSVKGAVNIPLGSLASKIASFKGKENVIVFCRSGNRSTMAKQILEKNGIANVVNGGTVNNVKQYA